MKKSRSVPSGNFEHILRACRADFQCFDWMLTVANRRSRTGQINNIIKFLIEINRLDDVMFNELIIGIIRKFFDVLFETSNQIVKTNNLIIGIFQ